MKNTFKPASFLCYVLTLIAFFFGGMFLSAFTGAAEGQGLAGGAIVMFYGLVTALIALILAVIFATQASIKKIKIANIILGVIVLGLAAFTVSRIMENRPLQEPERQQQPTTPVAPASMVLNQGSSTHDGIEEGMGFFKPNFYKNRVVYFYGEPNLDKAVNDHTPVDSVVFRQIDGGGVEIASAPPWLVPAHLKMDYELLFFKVLSVGQDFLMLIGNDADGSIAYMVRSAGDLFYWPEFLLTVHSVEWMDGAVKNVHLKPAERSSLYGFEYDFMDPMMVRGDWLLVRCLDVNYQVTGKGWVKWRQEGQRVISYSLLS